MLWRKREMRPLAWCSLLQLLLLLRNYLLKLLYPCIKIRYVSL